MKIAWGPTSSILAGLILASLIPLIEQWQDTGQFPTGQAWITAALAVVLAVGRYAQTLIPTPPTLVDELPEEPPATPTDYREQP